MYPYHQPLRLTAKTGALSSNSTHVEEDTLFQPGLTATSRAPRSRRPQVEESHLQHVQSIVYRPENQERSHAYGFARPNTASMNPRYTQRTATPPEGTFVGPFFKEMFIEVAAGHLDRQAEFNADIVPLPTHSEPESVFFSVTRPEIPTSDYIRRLVTYTQCSPAAFIVMLIYLDRISRINPRLLITPYNMHRLLVTALTLACKVLDDRCFSNVHYAKVGGIPTGREMNRLELQFLKYVDYRLHVRKECYDEKIFSLQAQPPPTSPISIAFEGSAAAVTASSHDTDETQSMMSSVSGTSSSQDPRYRGRAEGSQYATASYSNMNMDKRTAGRNGGRPTFPAPSGKTRRREHHSAPGYLGNHMHVVHDSG